jgi:hypothetical protein
MVDDYELNNRGDVFCNCFKPAVRVFVKLLALQRVHDRLFHAFRRQACPRQIIPRVPQRHPSHTSKPTNGRDSLYWYGAPRFTQM